MRYLVNVSNENFGDISGIYIVWTITTIGRWVVFDKSEQLRILGEWTVFIYIKCTIKLPELFLVYLVWVIIFTFRNYKVIISCRMQSTIADIQWILELMITLLYVKTHVWTSACVAKLTSGASCSWSWLLKIILLFTKLCYVFEGELFLSATMILWINFILSCLKMNLNISHKLR